MNKPLIVSVLLCDAFLVGCSERTLVLPPVATQNESVDKTADARVVERPIYVAPRRPTPSPPPPPHWRPRDKPTPRPEPPQNETAPAPEIRVEAPGFRLRID